jgi:hypothetical protein
MLKYVNIWFMNHHNQAPTTEQPLTFAELEVKADATADEVIASLRDDAESGAAISSNVVISVIERISPTYEDLGALQTAAVSGIVAQARIRNRTEQAEYALVVGHVGIMLENHEEV